MVNLENLKVGDFLTEVQTYKVSAIEAGSVHVKNFSGNRITIARGIVKRDCSSHKDFNKEVMLTSTELTKKFNEFQDGVFTVNFMKQTKDAEIGTSINNKYMEAIRAIQQAPKEATEKQTKALNKQVEKIGRELQKIAREGKKGTERTLVGIKQEMDVERGRTVAIDLEKHYDSDCKGYAVVQIDNRKIRWFIHNGVKYIEKSIWKKESTLPQTPQQAPSQSGAGEQKPSSTNG